MPRLSCNQLSTFRWTFDEDLYHYRKAGFEAIGIWRRKLLDFGEERAVELIEESGLAVSNLTWAGGFTGIDGRSLEESIADARQAIYLAAQVGADCLVTFPGGRNCHTLRHASRLLNSALEKLLPVAEEFGITLAIKPMHPACAGEWTFLTSLEETAEVIATHGSARLRMAYDTYHFPLEGSRLLDLADISHMIALVQLADTQSPHGVDLDRCPLGEGRVPVVQIVKGLIEGGYQGYFDVEVMGPSVEHLRYNELLTHTRQAYDDILSRAASNPSLASGASE